MAPERIVDITVEEMRTRFKPKVAIEEIFHDCCLVFDTMPDKVRNGNRTWYNTRIRKITSLVALYTGSFNLQQIADTLGYESHASILSNKKMIHKYLQTKDSLWLTAWGEYVSKSKVWPLIK